MLAASVGLVWQGVGLGPGRVVLGALAGGGVLVSSRYPGLRGGYWVVYAGGFGNPQEHIYLTMNLSERRQGIPEKKGNGRTQTTSP